MDGAITANGGGNPFAMSGAGAGGSIFLIANVLTGSGLISADGGSSDGSNGGGAGRIALNLSTNNFLGTTRAIGGWGASQNGGGGTIYTKLEAWEFGEVLVDNAGRGGTTALSADLWPPDCTFDLKVARAVIITSEPVTLRNLTLTNGGILRHNAGQAGFHVKVIENLFVHSGGAINVNNMGYGSNLGPGAGESSAGGSGAGGGHGGRGGNGSWGSPGGSVYGSAVEPITFGSGGGSYSGYTAGPGGGAVRLTVGGSLLVNGAITANGDGVFFNYASGAGAGGSIFLTAGTLTGSGQVSANGGNSDMGGGGGGGRIALYLAANNFTGTVSVARGGGISGSNGTIYASSGISLSGTVRDARKICIAGAFVSATGGFTTTTAANGTFTLMIPASWSGLATASAPGMFPTSNSYSFTNLTTPQFELNFTLDTLRQPTVSLANVGGTMRLSWDSRAGLNYQALSSLDLVSWTTLGQSQSGTGNVMIQDCPATNSSWQFYRVQAAY